MTGGAEDSRIFCIRIIAEQITSHPVPKRPKCRAPRREKASKKILEQTEVFCIFGTDSFVLFCTMGFNEVAEILLRLFRERFR